MKKETLIPLLIGSIILVTALFAIIVLTHRRMEPIQNDIASPITEVQKDALLQEINNTQASTPSISDTEKRDFLNSINNAPPNTSSSTAPTPSINSEQQKQLLDSINTTHK